MNINQKSTSAIACLSLLLGLSLVGAAGCSNDNPSDSTPALFRPAPGTTTLAAPLKLSFAPEAPTPTKGATLYKINLKLNSDNLGRDAYLARFEIVRCQVTVSPSTGEALVSSLENAQGLSPCEAGDKPDDLGAFLIGTTNKTGSLTFSIQMTTTERKATFQGSTEAIPVQPGGTVTQDLVATPVPQSSDP